MAKKAKAEEAEKPNEAEAEEKAEGEEKAAEGAPKKRGLIGKIFGFLGFLKFLNPLAILKLSRMMQMIVVGGLLVVVGGGGAAYYFLMPAGGGEKKVAANAPIVPANLPSAQTTFFDVPDIIVNIQTPDNSSAYLKLSVSLEIDQPDAKTLVEPVLPRVIDQFQTYLRELRVEDIRGSAGVMRLKEELLRRVNLALAPLPVRDVLLKEMIVQ
jgi:flagellar FliL protein